MSSVLPTSSFSSRSTSAADYFKRAMRQISGKCALSCLRSANALEDLVADLTPSRPGLGDTPAWGCRVRFRRPGCHASSGRLLGAGLVERLAFDRPSAREQETPRRAACSNLVVRPATALTQRPLLEIRPLWFGAVTRGDLEGTRHVWLFCACQICGCYWSAEARAHETGMRHARRADCVLCHSRSDLVLVSTQG